MTALTHTHTIPFTHHWLEDLILSGELGVGQTKWKQARLIIYIRAGHRTTRATVFNSRITFHAVDSVTT